VRETLRIESNESRAQQASEGSRGRLGSGYRLVLTREGAMLAMGLLMAEEGRFEGV
jgi:hypothetical protein